MDKKQFTTALDISTHVVLSLVLAVFFWYRTGAWLWPLLTVVGGVLIDLDHFVDYFLYYGAKLNVGDFFNYRYRASGKCYIFFHSWELMIFLWISSLFFRWLIPLASGVTLHLLIDQIPRHGLNLKVFSLVYRWRQGFCLDAIVPDK